MAKLQATSENFLPSNSMCELLQSIHAQWSNRTGMSKLKALSLVQKTLWTVYMYLYLYCIFFPQMERDREMFAVNDLCFTAIQGGIFFVK